MPNVAIVVAVAAVIAAAVVVVTTVAAAAIHTTAVVMAAHVRFLRQGLRVKVLTRLRVTLRQQGLVRRRCKAR